MTYDIVKEYIYLVGIAGFFVANMVAFVLMYLDKRKAVKRKERIPESVLIGSAVFMGGLGAIFGMHCFRHKTSKEKRGFQFFIMLGIGINICVGYFVVRIIPVLADLVVKVVG